MNDEQQIESFLKMTPQQQNQQMIAWGFSGNQAMAQKASAALGAQNLKPGIGSGVSTMPVATNTMKNGGTDSLAPNGTRNINSETRYDAEGRPIRNAYNSILNSDGSINNAFSLSRQIGPNINLNTQGADEIRKRAFEQGPSTWARLAEEKQQAEQMNQLQNAQKTSAQGMNAGYNQLRSRGGLSAGQRERLATQGARGLANQSQGILNQGAQARMGINLQDQQMKDQFLGQVPGLDLQNANFQQSQRAYGDAAKQFDLGNSLRDVGGLNAYNADAYGKAMQEWAAGKSADAQVRASNSGGKK